MGVGSRIRGTVEIRQTKDPCCNVTDILVHLQGTGAPGTS